ncbi:MAG TPA: hypothetical protein VGB45_05220 [Abditibacterium sp.]|jgi:hypothetical protein
MNYRVIPLGAHPLQLLNHIRAAGCFIRLEETALRGPVAFIGDGRVWAVATLRDVKSATKHKEAPQGYLWCFSDLQDVEGVNCADVSGNAMFLNGEDLEPQMLQASAQAELRRIFALDEPAPELEPLEVETRAPTDEDYSELTESVDAEIEPDAAPVAMPPDYQISHSKETSRAAKAGQLEMF